MIKFYQNGSLPTHTQIDVNMHLKIAYIIKNGHLKKWNKNNLKIIIINLQIMIENCDTYDIITLLLLPST